MKVSELAKELKTTSDEVLATLKSLKLKAKDSKQELSAAVISVVKSQLKIRKVSATTVKKPGAISSEKKEKAKEKPKVVTKKVAKKVVKATAPVKKTTMKKVKEKVIKEKKDIDQREPANVKKIEAIVPVKKNVETKKKATLKESLKAKRKISKEPLITLKPLARKRRKSVGGRSDRTRSDGRQGIDHNQTLSLNPVGEKESVTQVDVSAEIKSQVKSDTSQSLQSIEIKVPITVKDLSIKLSQKPSALLKHLMSMGLFAHINQSLDESVIEKICKDFGYNFVEIKTQEEQVIEEHKQDDDDSAVLTLRAPVVTFMGHVDHGKTSLLDRVRKSKVVDSEHGGITQHMGAYSVAVPKGRITFLDTPGHEAFTAMRARGANITDLVVVVIAADEGIMPQTEEAIDHARAADVPIIIALNKIDRKNADPDRVKKQLSEIGLASEDWGGKTVVANVSAMTGEGIDELLELILLESELLELKANSEKKASGIVVEAHLSQGKGAVCTLIVQSGTLRDSDFIVVGPYYGKVRAMHDDRQRIVKEAGPSTPVEILGLSQVPEAGEPFYVVTDEKVAREITVRRAQQIKTTRLNASQKITLEDLYSQIQDGTMKELNVILKADVQGSLEALKDSLQKIPSDKVKTRFIHVGVGDVNASDVLLAAASNAIIIAFHVAVGARAKEALDKDPVDVREYRIIYDAVDDMRKALEGLLEAKVSKRFLARIDVREVFKLTKGIVAGCYVSKGKVHRKANVDVLRKDEIIFSGVISSLKRFKDDVKELSEGMECGVTIEGFTKYEAGDIFEVYEIEKIAQKL